MAYILNSPAKYIQGKDEIKNVGKYTSVYGKKAFIIISGSRYERLKSAIDENKQHGIEIEYAIFAGECTYAEMERLAKLYKAASCNIVVGVGGGKILDTAKGVANYCDSPLAIVPTSAAQDAPCSSLSVVYKEDGQFDSFMFHKTNPDLVIVDSRIICEAPARMLAAGMGDGLSTVYEARACYTSDTDNTAGGKQTETARMMTELCYRLIMENGLMAYKAVENKVVTRALESVIEANIFLSGIGAEGTGDAGAHGLYNALTILPECRKYMHGELVAFGILVQLVLENASAEEIEAILAFNTAVKLPVCFDDIGLSDVSREDLERVAQAAAEDSLVNMPFTVTAEDVYAAMVTADATGREYKSLR